MAQLRHLEDRDRRHCRNGFFSNGDAGNEPLRRDALTTAVRNGRRLVDAVLNKNMGIGSSRHDFVGDSMTTRRTSSAEQGCNDDSVAPLTCLMTDALLVHIRCRIEHYVSEELQKRVGGVRCGLQQGRCSPDVREAATSTATALLGRHCRVKYGWSWSWHSVSHL